MSKLRDQVVSIESRFKGAQLQACEHGNPVCLAVTRDFLAGRCGDIFLRASVCYPHFLEIEADVNYDLLAGVA